MLRGQSEIIGRRNPWLAGPRSLSALGANPRRGAGIYVLEQNGKLERLVCEIRSKMLRLRTVVAGIRRVKVPDFLANHNSIGCLYSVSPRQVEPNLPGMVKVTCDRQIILALTHRLGGRLPNGGQNMDGQLRQP